MQSNEVYEKIINNNLEPLYEIVDLAPYRLGYFIAKNNFEGSAHNEDSLFIYKHANNIIFGVSDGAGGHPKGKEASAIATNDIVSLYKRSTEAHFLNFIENINQNVRDLKAGAHCTFILCTIKENFFKSYNVGDSEVIFWNSSGKKLYSNIPQSEVGYLIQSGSMEQEDSLDDPNRHLVTNLIGDEAIRIESTSRIEIKKGNTIIVGSDGLFDNLSHDELASIMAQGSFDKSFETLVQRCLERNEENWRKEDDISFIVLRKTQSDNSTQE
tara:strand:- start:359428 stop:360237 length:810 start_codon:yes stop_codon:yes gene_type:complete